MEPLEVIQALHACVTQKVEDGYRTGDAIAFFQKSIALFRENTTEAEWRTIVAYVQFGLQQETERGKA